MEESKSRKEKENLRINFLNLIFELKIDDIICQVGIFIIYFNCLQKKLNARNIDKIYLLIINI